MKNIPAIDWKRTDTLIALALEEDLGDRGQRGGGDDDVDAQYVTLQLLE